LTVVFYHRTEVISQLTIGRIESNVNQYSFDCCRWTSIFITVNNFSRGGVGGV